MKGALNKELREELEKAAKKSKTFYEIREYAKINLEPNGDKLLFSFDGILPMGIRKTDKGEYEIFKIQTDYEKVSEIPIETIKV